MLGVSGDGGGFLRVEVRSTAAEAARTAASHLARELRAAARDRGRGLLAVSGGHSPAPMFRALAREDVPWERIELFQVDERDAPTGDPDRNWTSLHADLIAPVGLRPEQLHPAPLPSSGDLAAAARRYAEALESLAGRPPVLDLVHLGLGSDGHTASLVPGDAALDAREASVRATSTYRGRARLTLTFPTLDRARRVLWFVVGAEKRDALRRLRAGDREIPAARVRRERAILVCDSAAAGGRG
jgi:6-phosphogluconolactonase